MARARLAGSSPFPFQPSVRGAFTGVAAGREAGGRGFPPRGAASDAALRKAGRRRGPGFRRSAAATLDARRALLADLPSYGARRGSPVRAGPPPGGWPRLAPSS